MSKLILPGLTHAIVNTCSEVDFKASGVLAYVDLCFGPGDDNAIRGIPYKKLEAKTFAFQSPNTVIFKEGKKTLMTAFSGTIDKEVCNIANRAMERVKSLGPFTFNKRYLVNDKGASEAPLEKVAD